MSRMTTKPLTTAPLLNRELGMLAFNRRVLAQAADASVPLLERLRFLTIVSSNLDEFFEIRVAGLKEQVRLGITEAGRDGMTPKETLAVVTQEARELSASQYGLLNDVLLPALAQAGIRFLRRDAWTDAQRGGPGPGRQRPPPPGRRRRIGRSVRDPETPRRIAALCRDRPG
jgi:polyphosphate kinase